MKWDLICIAILIISTIMNFIADYFCKLWLQSGLANYNYLLANQILWISTGFIFCILAAKRGEMLTTATIWTCLSLINFAIVAYMTGEVISTRYIIAVILALIAVILTSW